MSKSSAKKKRAHLLRNGERDASLSRGLAHPSAHMSGKQKVKKTGLKEAGIKEGILMIVI